MVMALDTDWFPKAAAGSDPRYNFGDVAEMLPGHHVSVFNLADECRGICLNTNTQQEGTEGLRRIVSIGLITGVCASSNILSGPETAEEVYIFYFDKPGGHL